MGRRGNPDPNPNPNPNPSPNPNPNPNPNPEPHQVLGPLMYGTLYVRGVQAGLPTAPFVANVVLTFASLVLGFYALAAAAPKES